MPLCEGFWAKGPAGVPCVYGSGKAHEGKGLHAGWARQSAGLGEGEGPRWAVYVVGLLGLAVGA